MTFVQIQIYCMKQKDPSKGTSLSFLERFEGKKTAITKEGLHHLFEQQQNNLINNVSTNLATERKKIIKDASNKEFNRQRIAEIIRTGSQMRNEAKQSKTSRLSHRTQILRREPENQDSRKNQFTLPKIITRFSSSLNRLSNSERKSDVGRRNLLNNDPASKKMGLIYGKNMDDNAKQHLEFLNKLQQKLLGLRTKHDRS